MALKSFVLPVCDVCGEPWLPQPGPARDNPRKFDAEQRAKGMPPMRCGKCKSPGWDKNFTGDRRRKNPLGDEGSDGSGGMVMAGRCDHGLLHCPQCPAVGG